MNLSQQTLQQMLIDSELAQMFFRDAQSGFLFDHRYHDLFYDQHEERICSRSFNFSDFKYQFPEQLIHGSMGKILTGTIIRTSISSSLFLFVCSLISSFLSHQEFQLIEKSIEHTLGLSHEPDPKHEQQQHKKELGIEL